MIKVQATINGVINKSATIRIAGDGKKFIGFPVKLTVPGSRNNMPGKELTVRYRRLERTKFSDSSYLYRHGTTR